MTRSSEPAGPPQWTPGAGVERMRREAPHLIPAHVSDEAIRRADEIIALAAEGTPDGIREERHAA